MESKLAERLKLLRAEFGISQARLAELISVSLSFIAHIELDKSSVSTAVLISLAEFFDVSTDYLLGLSDIKKHPKTS